MSPLGFSGLPMDIQHYICSYVRMNSVVQFDSSADGTLALGGFAPVPSCSVSDESELLQCSGVLSLQRPKNFNHYSGKSLRRRCGTKEK